MKEQSIKSDKTILSFFPEGGHIIKDVQNRIAFKLTDTEGKPLSSELIVYSSDGKILTKTKPIHEGMGMFILPAEWQALQSAKISVWMQPANKRIPPK